MSYLQQYNSIIKSESRTQKSTIEPLNVYRISRYKTVEGQFKPMAGDRSSLVFLVGVYPHPKKDRLLNCLKISEIPPHKFFTWVRGLRNDITATDISTNRLNRWLIKGDKEGKRLFEQHIKPSPIVYNLKESIYRTYDVEGIYHIQEVFFDINILKKELA